MHRIHPVLIGTVRIQVFCKHPRKLEIKSDGDILDVAFYHTSHKLFRFNLEFSKTRRTVEKVIDF